MATLGKAKLGVSVLVLYDTVNTPDREQLFSDDVILYLKGIQEASVTRNPVPESEEEPGVSGLLQ